LTSSSSSVNNDRTPVRKHKSRDIDEELDRNSSSSSINNDRTSIRKHKSRDIDEELDGKCFFLLSKFPNIQLHL
ncbi:unnamed protein product, partial [Rotaria sp. Silwood1]